MPNGPSPRSGTAVVIGAGIAGLSVARVLAGGYAQVIVLDRDRLPDQAVPRRGVPQGYHGAVLLAAGQQALTAIFPGLVDDLVAAGAVPFEPGVEMAVFRFGALYPREPVGLSLVSFSRPLLELTLRQRLAALPNVTVYDDTSVAGLTGDGTQVTGVTLADGRHFATDMVVDCTGRGARSDRWIAALGFPTPEASEVKINVGYATRLLRRAPGDLPEGKALLILPAPPHEKRAGMALPIEGDRWLVTMGGWHGEFPASGDWEGFAAHARALPYQGLTRLLDRAEPLTDVVSFGFPSSRRRHFEQLTYVPAGYLAMGDAFCCFNPIYGQGMTCAAMQAVALGRLLDEHGVPTAAMARAFYQEAARIVATPWQFASGGDFAYPETAGDRPKGIAVLNKYSRRIQLATQVDPELRKLFTTVQHLLVPPDVLRTPGMVLRVLRTSRLAPGLKGGPVELVPEVAVTPVVAVPPAAPAPAAAAVAEPTTELPLVTLAQQQRGIEGTQRALDAVLIGVLAAEGVLDGPAGDSPEASPAPTGAADQAEVGADVGAAVAAAVVAGADTALIEPEQDAPAMESSVEPAAEGSRAPGEADGAAAGSGAVEEDVAQPESDDEGGAGTDSSADATDSSSASDAGDSGGE